MVLENVKKILAEYKDDAGLEITPETTFEELELDSLDIVELLMKVEEEFNITLEAESQMTTVSELVAKIEEQL
ncbi:MAG: phosphopantetheine-binding protein [Clostridiales bacterium]|jgi:acyl carrier protein|nr:phosphopantetheine-binding protein [Clostridiales bacterium]MDR2713537.1 phosphopantetheine-binding protein [Clostridiales bacterium]